MWKLQQMHNKREIELSASPVTHNRDNRDTTELYSKEGKQKHSNITNATIITTVNNSSAVVL